MKPLSKANLSVSNIVVPDACIDLIVSFDEKYIGFSGMRKTVFDFKYKVQSHSFGIRMIPGAFHQLTGLSANMAMDTFFPAETIFNEFNSSYFSLFQLKEKKIFYSNLYELY